MTSEQRGALRMRRDMLQRDLNALKRGEAGNRLTEKEASFYRSRLGAVDSLLMEPCAPRAKAQA
jgi:hypothetical protein